jgi:TadE-like protein
MLTTNVKYVSRRAVAAVEFALILPLIVLLLLGAIEGARAVMVTHALQEAAQAGCRVYSVEGSTKAQASAIIDTALLNAGVSNYLITFSPTSKADVNVPLEPVSINVSIPYSKVAWVAPIFLSGANLSGNCVMPADLIQSDGGDRNGYVDTNDDHEVDGNFRYEKKDSSGDDDDD